MKRIILLFSIFLYISTIVAQTVDGYRFLQRIRGIRLDDSKVQEIMVDERNGSIAISYRSKKILYLSILKLHSWDKINDYRLDGSVELYNSVFNNDGSVFYANFDAYKLLFAKIDLASGEVDTVECSATPRGCQPATTAQYKVEYTTDDRMYYFVRDVDHPNDLIVYIDKVYFTEITNKMQEELGREVYAREVKEKMEADARAKYGPLPGQNKTASTSSGSDNAPSNEAPKKSLIITKADIVQLLETGSFDKAGMSVKLNAEAKQTLQTATANPAIGSKPKSLDAISYKVGEVVKLNNILFDQGKATISASSFPELDKLVGIMNNRPSMQIQVNGHTNNIGTHNLEISEQRAKAVVDYLVSKGIAASRLKYKGYGDTQPIASNDTPEGQAKNRRVEFVILKN